VWVATGSRRIHSTGAYSKRAKTYAESHSALATLGKQPEEIAPVVCEITRIIVRVSTGVACGGG